MPLWSRFQDATYDDPDGPAFSGQFAGETPALGKTLTVVTYNINFGRKTDLAIEEFQRLEPLRHADIILLQEMDETGTEQLAQALRSNFTYFPATVARHGLNFGNAILSRWPLSDGSKLILPGRHPINNQIRIAVRAMVEIKHLQVVAYSVHTETVSVRMAYRQRQVEALVNEIRTGNGTVVAGGDFNTVSRGGIQRLAEQFAAIGLARVSAGAGPTVAKLGFRASAADHIFARGFRRLTKGTLVSATASDHFPVWVKLAVPDGESQQKPSR
jgi:endonuclease/exonuclease/phosphatase (EEP) superfamily protein YafD